MYRLSASYRYESAECAGYNGGHVERAAGVVEIQRGGLDRVLDTF